MRQFLLSFALLSGLFGPATAQVSVAAPDTAATICPLLTAECAAFPAAATWPALTVAATELTGRFTPTCQQISTVEKLLPQADLKAAYARAPTSYYAHYPATIRQQLGQYRRQYFGFYNVQGHACLYINFFLEQFEEAPGTVPIWLRRPILVRDGGAAFWSIYYDLTQNRFYDFQHNGEG